MYEGFGETDLLLRCPGEEERRRLLAEFFRGYRKRLQPMVEQRLDPSLKGRIGASDVFQDTYLEASRRLGAFLRDPGVPVFIWVRFLLDQKLRALRRHHGRERRDVHREMPLHHDRRLRSSSEALAARLAGKGTSPSEAAARKESLTRLRQVLERLKPGDREIIVLRHFQQLSTREAARVLDVPEEVARKRYFRALERLKTSFTRPQLDP